MPSSLEPTAIQIMLKRLQEYSFKSVPSVGVLKLYSVEFHYDFTGTTQSCTHL